MMLRRPWRQSTDLGTRITRFESPVTLRSGAFRSVRLEREVVSESEGAEKGTREEGDRGSKRLTLACRDLLES